MRRRAAILLTLGAALVAAMAAVACGQPAPAAGSGSTCELTTDCQEGYACITQPDGTRQCSSDFSSIQTTEEGGMDAPAAATEGGTPPAGDATTPPVEGGNTPETGGPQETGGTKDTGGTPETSSQPETSVPETSTTPETGTGGESGTD